MTDKPMKQKIIDGVIDRPTNEIAHRLGIERDAAEKLQIGAIHLINMPENLRTLWAVNIIVTYRPGQGGLWHAQTTAFDEHFANSHKAVEIEIKTKYYCKSLDDAIDNILQTAQQMGIMWSGLNGDPKPTIFYKGDGQDSEYRPPKGWRQLLNDQARRIGWEPAY